jgi:outer membrane protein assembly factor BamB
LAGFVWFEVHSRIQKITLLQTMKSNPSLCALATCLLAASAACADESLANWGQWRGPLATGFAPQANPPTEWSETKNVKWKVSVPGSGLSTPIVWGEKIFLLTAVPGKKTAPASASPPEDFSTQPQEQPGGRRRGGGAGGGRGEKPTDKYQFMILCLDRKSGKTLWQKTAVEAVPHEGHHQDGTFASGSPTTDGKHLISFFGSQGIYCHDLDGNLKWSKDLGDLSIRNSFGEGASAALHGNTVVVQWDHEGDDDFVAAFDKSTGKELWRKARSEPTTWATPLVVSRGKSAEVILNATGNIRSYDLADGRELWNCGGMTVNVIPSPVADDDTIYVMSGFRGAALHAIKRGSSGALTGTDAIRWSHNRGTPYVPSPVLANGSLCFFSANKTELTCLDAKTGKPRFEGERIPGTFNVYASPVATKDRLYVLDREGKCVVLKLGNTLDVLATNKLDERTDASIAIAGGDLFIRGKQSLYCISEK